jgi:hypothetical protein
MRADGWSGMVVEVWVCEVSTVEISIHGVSFGGCGCADVGVEIYSI